MDDYLHVPYRAWKAIRWAARAALRSKGYTAAELASPETRARAFDELTSDLRGPDHLPASQRAAMIAAAANYALDREIRSART
ncbi:hypothetical protein [Actinacidiphila sp. bgisy160]|uniref:hypothetical protein n=1 Tax=Actinacidiphila sp. bgisy160 TaxID=3413796 RepID=UPI003D72C20E